MSLSPSSTRAFCTITNIGAVAVQRGDKDYPFVPGSGTQQLVLWWQTAPGEEWQQRVLDEQPTGARAQCYIP